MSVPEGPGCTGLTVTACWRGLCGTVGVKRPPATRGKPATGGYSKLGIGPDLVTRGGWDMILVVAGYRFLPYFRGAFM